MRRQPRVLHREVRLSERAREQHEPLRGARADDDRARVRDHPAHAAQVLGERAAQLGRPARVGVAESLCGRGGEHLAHRSQPLAARERRQVRIAGKEVEARARRRRLGGGRRRGRGRFGHVRSRASAREQVALRDELRVRVDDEPARDAEVACKHARGGQPRACAQTPAAGRLAQALLELRAQRAALVAAQLDEELRPRRGTRPTIQSGTQLCTQIGTVQGSTGSIS